MISLIPMAGAGSRFMKEGYRLPKPFLPIFDMPMFKAAITSFPSAREYIFIGHKKFIDKFAFADKVNQRFPGSKIYTVDTITEGQACSCLVAKDALLTKESLLISSIDYLVVYNESLYKKLIDDTSIDVIIWTFQTATIIEKSPEAFAYCRVDEYGNVNEVVEKKTISDNPKYDPAVVGSFYFKHSSDFVAGAESMISKNIRVNNEFYVGTSINQLIEQGKKVVAFPIDKFISLGDPFELEIFHFWEDFFRKENEIVKGVPLKAL